MPLSEVKERLRTAERAAGRPEGSVTLIAVSKVQPLERIDAVLKGGHATFGENRVQEAQGKWPDFKAAFPDTKLHLIGPLQTNKVRAAMELFDAIHSVDRSKLARSVARIADETGACPEIFVQV
ncbi:MAG: YggS family pyridoxal phosphate-dependent enzyme, partial [Pseudomonadota bacterium]